jgi:D-glycero-alpha-D-manno-heptose-7-phosphate kinase
MIITRSPLRISLGGGGTDLPSYYRRHSGFLMAAAIDKYVYITLHQTFQKGLILKYSKMEQVEEIEQVQHPIIRESMKFMNMTDPHLEITSMADIPAGTGLGSSGSFTTALLKALHIHEKRIVPTHELAEQACTVEIERLREPVGKQDQFIAAYGGVTCFQFLPNDKVEVTPLKVDSQTLYNLEDNLLMFFTGYSRSASSILKDQDDRSKKHDSSIIDNLHFTKDLGYKSKEALEAGDLRAFAALMKIHWEHKRQRGGPMSNPDIDRWYELAMANGALGGKLVGAGGGGFLMFYSEEKTRLRHVLNEAGLREVRFRFDFEGTRAVAQ